MTSEWFFEQIKNKYIDTNNMKNIDITTTSSTQVSEEGWAFITIIDNNNFKMIKYENSTFDNIYTYSIIIYTNGILGLTTDCCKSNPLITSSCNVGVSPTDCIIYVVADKNANYIPDGIIPSQVEQMALDSLFHNDNTMLYIVAGIGTLGLLYLLTRKKNNDSMEQNNERIKSSMPREIELNQIERNRLIRMERERAEKRIENERLEKINKEVIAEEAYIKKIEKERAMEKERIENL